MPGRQSIRSKATGSARPKAGIESPLWTAGTPFLNGRALGIAVRTVHAAVVFERFEQFAAAFAFVEELTRVYRHPFPPGVPASRAGDC